jgi:predicted short-subunit dehydrogenase-like oxidoreductase (DUF2520 family)
MIKIAIIGSGNLAQHLISACEIAPEIELVQVFARNKNSINHLINPEKIISDFEDLQLVDLYIIAVSDNAIANVSAQIPFKNRLVAHTSGSVSLEDLNENNRKGVFYPLQTFTKSKKIDFSQIPICIESENATDFQLLEKVAQSISQKVFAINSQQRKSLHVAAVFVCNFVNHLYEIGNEICIDNKVPFEILKPLIMETADKINTILPIDAQTGPAKRNDTQTINSHLNFLEDENQKEIYKLLTKSIIDNGKKL